MNQLVSLIQKPKLEQQAAVKLTSQFPFHCVVSQQRGTKMKSNTSNLESKFVTQVEFSLT